MARRWVWGVLGLVGIGVVGAWALSPLYAMQALKSAAERGDETALERLVDFPAVRQGLKDDLNARMLAEIQSGHDGLDPGMAGLGLLLGPALVSGAVDAVITPRGVATLVRTAEAPDPADALTSRGNTVEPANSAPDLRRSWTYRGANRVEIRLSRADDAEQRVTLNMDRQGLFGWRLVRIDLPET